MSIVKGSTSEVRRDFYDKLQSTFPLESALFNPNRKSAEQAAFDAGIQYAIQWIGKHASIG